MKETTLTTLLKLALRSVALKFGKRYIRCIFSKSPEFLHKAVGIAKKEFPQLEDILLNSSYSSSSEVSYSIEALRHSGIVELHSVYKHQNTFDVCLRPSSKKVVEKEIKKVFSGNKKALAAFGKFVEILKKTALIEVRDETPIYQKNIGKTAL